jgi:hypothetical protein
MDPYIEACGAWSVFHYSFISECQRYLNRWLPGNYVATLGDRIELVSEEDLGLLVRQDIEWLDEPKQLYVQIRRVPEQNVVTEVELLSPSNKRKGGEDRAAYLAKRRVLFHHGVNLVEIDLLLAGERLKMRQQLPQGHYYAFVTHARAAHECDVYGWNVRSKLPTIPVPLKEGEGEVSLDLGSVFQATYDDGRFDLVVAYRDPPPTLSDADKFWAAEQLKTQAS